MIKRNVFDSYPSALEALRKKLCARAFDKDEYYIVLTPDRYTLAIESALFKDAPGHVGGALDCEVLTVARLTRRVLGDKKTLSREGAVMLTASAVAAVEDKLVYYRRAAKYPDFARQVYEAILQLGSSCADAAQLISRLDASDADKTIALKLGELALIKSEYDKLKADALDSADRLNALISAVAGSALVKNSHFFAIGYFEPTKLNDAVFSAIAGAARSFESYEAVLPDRPKAPSEVWRMSDPISQYKFIASRIREYVATENGRYGDVCVVCPEPRALRRIFNEYGIAYYADCKTALIDTPPLAALALIKRLASESALSTDRLISLCKNPFSGVDGTDADYLRDYLVGRGIEYAPVGLEIAEPHAARAFSRAVELIGAFAAAPTFADACEAAMEKADFDGIAEKLTAAVEGADSDSDVLLTDMIGPMRILVGLIRRYGGGAADATMFFSAAQSVNVNSLPHSSDRVTVVGPESLRLVACKKLFVTDFNEGKLPTVTADGGLLVDAELKRLGGAVSPTALQKNKVSRAELAAVMSNAAETVCTYSVAGGGRKSAFLSSVCDAELDYDRELGGLRVCDDPVMIARYACVPSAAREMISRDMTVHGKSLAASLPDEKQSAAAPFSPTIDGIAHKTISVSELNDWFACPYKRFLTRSVGVGERKTLGLSAPDFGLIIHSFMERFVAEKLYELDGAELAARAEEVALDIVNGLEKRLSAADSERIVRDARDYAAENAALLRAGRFLPKLTEYRFDGNIKLGGADFVGVVDRVDTCGDAARIIDYKTRADKAFSEGSCRDGRDMQLPLYAAALRAENIDVSGFFYLRMRNVFDDDESPLSGLMEKSPELAKNYDEALERGMKSDILGVRLDDGGQSFVGRGGKVSEKEKFDGIISASVSTAALAVDEMDSGYIERAPTDKACEFCPYYALCENKRVRVGYKKPSAKEGA